MSSFRRNIMMFTRPVESQGVPSPTISPASGNILSSQTITISIEGSAVSAEYSFDNSIWVTYSSPFTLSGNATVYARALDANGNYSEVVSKSYSVRIYDAQIEYLQSTGTQYIDTGIVITARNYEFEIVLEWSGATAGIFETFFGFMAGGSATTPRMGFHKHLAKWMFGTNATTSTGIGVDSTKHTFNLKSWEGTNREELFIDGVSVKTGTTSGTGFATNTLSAFLLARNRGSSIDNRASAKLYSLSFTAYSDNDHTVVNQSYNFIPVRVEQAGYLYDTVNKTLLGNAGTGNFTLGNDI